MTIIGRIHHPYLLHYTHFIEKRFSCRNRLSLPFVFCISYVNLERSKLDLSPECIVRSDQITFGAVSLPKTNNLSKFQVPSYNRLEVRTCDDGEVGLVK